MHTDVARPNPACARYFGRDGQRGKDAQRELLAGLRKYALLTGHGLPGSPPASPSATSPRSPLPPTSGRNGSASSGSAEAAPLPSPTSAAAPAGLSLTLLQEVTRYVPHGFSTRAVAKHLVLPLASQAKTALCEVPGLLHRKQINPASVHIVHGWDAPFADLSTLMQEYLTEQGLPTTTSLFVDVLCTNLYNSSTPAQRIRDTRAQLKAAPSIVVTLSSTGALTRTWFLYQLWVLAKEHLLERTTVLLSPPLDRDMVRMAAANISLRHSQATQGEKDAILADVLRSHTSSSTFDEEVREALLLKLLTAEEVAAQEAEEAAARLEQEAAEADRRQQARLKALEETELRQELRAFQAGSAVSPAPAAPSGAPDASPRKPEGQSERTSISGTLPGGFDPGSFMANLFGLSKQASATDDGPLTESLGPISMPKLPKPPSQAFAAVEEEPEDPNAPPTMQLLSRLYKAVYFNQERLLGMVAQFDADDKGYLTVDEAEEFVDFFAEGGAPADCHQVALALCRIAGDNLSAANMLSAVKTAEEEGVDPASKSFKASHRPRARLEEMVWGVEEDTPEPLSASVQTLLSRLYKAVYFNQERLVGMVAQFDEHDKGYLSMAELEGFIDFFADAEETKDAEALAVAITDAIRGRIDHDNIVDALKAVQARVAATAATAPAQAADSGAAATAAAGASAAPAAAGTSEPLSASVKTLLARLYKAVYFNQERLVGMVAQFDEHDKGYLSMAELESFIDFFADSTDPKDLEALAVAITDAGGRIDHDNIIDALKAVQAKAAAEPAPAPAPAAPATATATAAAAPAAAAAPSPVPAAAPAPPEDTAAAAAPAAAAVDEWPDEEDVPLSVTAKAVMARLWKAVYFNQERLVGMIAQFDEHDVGHLSTAQMADFIDFFVDGCQPSDVRALAAAISRAADGAISYANMVAAIKAVQNHHKVTSNAGPAAAPAAAPAPVPSGAAEVVTSSAGGAASSAASSPAEAVQEAAQEAAQEGVREAAHEGVQEAAQEGAEEAAPAEMEAAGRAAEEEVAGREAGAEVDVGAADEGTAAAEEVSAPEASVSAAQEDAAPADSAASAGVEAEAEAGTAAEDAQTPPEAGAEAEVKGEAEAEAEAEAETKEEAEAEAETTAETEAVVEAEEAAEAEAEAEAEAVAEAKGEAEAESKEGAEAEAEAEVQEAAEAGTEAAAGDDAAAGGEVAGAGEGAEPAAEDAEAEAEVRGEPEAQAQGGAEAQGDAEVQGEAEGEREAQGEAEASAEAQGEPEAQGETEATAEAQGEAQGEAEGAAEVQGEAEAAAEGQGEAEGEPEAQGEVEATAEVQGEAQGEVEGAAEAESAAEGAVEEQGEAEAAAGAAAEAQADAGTEEGGLEEAGEAAAAEMGAEE